MTNITNNLIQDLPTEMFKRTGVVPVTINPIPDEYRDIASIKYRQEAVDLLKTADFSAFEACINSKSETQTMNLGIKDDDSEKIKTDLTGSNWNSSLQVLAYNVLNTLEEKIMKPIYFVFAKKYCEDPSTVTLDNAKERLNKNAIFKANSIDIGFMNAIAQFFGLVGVIPEMLTQNPEAKPQITDLQKLWHNTLNFYQQLTRLNLPLIKALTFTVREDHHCDFPAIYNFLPQYFGLNNKQEIRAREGLVADSTDTFNNHILFKDNGKPGRFIATGCPLSYVTINDHGKRIRLTDALHKYLCEVLDQFLLPHLDKMINTEHFFKPKPISDDEFFSSLIVS